MISITIPHKYITTEVLSLLGEFFYKTHEVFETERDLLTFAEDVDDDISEIEDFLVMKGIPFNRVCDDPELERKFRPSRENMNFIDVEVHLVDGHTVIRTDAIRKILEKDSADAYLIIAEIKKALSDIDPVVSPLSEWAKMDIPVVSTAEVELDRFSDIL